jgi:hypothetical protein
MQRRTFLLASVGWLAALEKLCGQTTPPSISWLTSQSGPFLICVGSFRGDNARELAQRLASYVQQNYRCRVYLFSRSEEERRKQEEELRRLRELYGPNQRFRRYRIEDEYAVLVGDFRSWDDARRELDRIKQLPPPKDVPLPVLFILRPERNEANENNSGRVKGEYAPYNPFRYAFVVPNPLLPKSEQHRPQNLGRTESQQPLQPASLSETVYSIGEGVPVPDDGGWHARHPTGDEPGRPQPNRVGSGSGKGDAAARKNTRLETRRRRFTGAQSVPDSAASEFELRSLCAAHPGNVAGDGGRLRQY